MARRRFLIAYDISEPRRLRRVIKVMERFGDRLQYSVFLCDLSGVELPRWHTAMLEVVKLTEDSVVVIDLGPVGASAKIQTLGTPRRLPNRDSTVV